MATSPNYGWLEPDNTDLVKNGALAIRTLGNAIDTTMATMTPKSIVDAKGDLIAASANDTPARLAVGNNGETLVADSAATTGLRYQSAYNGNAIINGGLDIWQRGTSFAAPTNNTFVADRWAWSSSSVASKTVSRQSSGLTGFQYSIRVARDSGNTNTAANYIGYSMETSDAIRFAGQTITFSFYAKAGANYSPTSSLLGYRLGSGTGTDQNFLTGGYTGNVNLLDNTQAITTTWTRYSFTTTVGSTATELGLFFYATPTGTAGANDWYEITGVQVELGSVATTFKRSNGSGGTIQGELAACQRYFWQWATGNGAAIGMGSNYSATQAETNVQFPVTMRVPPTLIQTTGTGYYAFQRNSGFDTFNSFTANIGTTQLINLYNNSEISGTAGNAGTMFTANAAASLAFSAEL